MGKNNELSYLQTSLPRDVATEFRVLCLKLGTNIKAKLKELILNELEFWRDVSDEEIEEMIKIQRERNQK